MGLRYLHSQTTRKHILHHDLSSNNILLSSNLKAKISDMGGARFSDSSKLTMTPGTPVFMPPEAKVETPQYDTSIDIFSYGIIMIHIFTGKWPDPKDNSFNTIPVSEAKRHEESLKIIGNDHPLIDLIYSCIDDNPQQRPNAEETAQRLSRIASEFPPTNYTYSPLEMKRIIDSEEKEKEDLRRIKEDKDSIIRKMENQHQKRIDKLEQELKELRSPLTTTKQVSEH